MTRGGYEPLPGSQDTPYQSVDDEMERAFESDEEDQEDASLAQQSSPPTPAVRLTGQAQEGAYDFEREYDRPPPGNPPASSATLAGGNSNGMIPSPTSVLRPDPLIRETRKSFFRRAVGALLPQHYARVPAHDGEPMVTLGGGLDNDGVFSNVTARPTPPRTVQDEQGDVHVMPEDAQNEAPPSYAAAQADAAPPYWDTTVHAPLGGADDLLIEGLPPGSMLSFAFNFLISVSFQFVGFMLTYLLHTSHAAKYGSRAGLGVTLIQYGLFSKSINDELDTVDGTTDGEAGTTLISGKSVRLARRRFETPSPRLWSTSSDGSDDDTVYLSNGAMHDWLSFLLMTVGWILVLSSILGFARVKRWERSIPTSTAAPEIITPEIMQRDAEIRSRLADAFGV
ncbi:hypothetical protein ACEPAF_8149 [Sanghuangporus sanghuang]|uniref:Metal homeostatis protein bsd2 n=1 Tax=Sanghuangporus baumii TaxID=108892 RepID=A0A9Q5I1E9_SANBA|nr:hypothetical protein A7U60_g2860 [Sanghuangporus baumii]